jgi:hypothetical protein
MLLEILDRWGRPAEVEMVIRRDTVETRCRDKLAGIADRDQLRAWLRAPTGVFAYDDLAWLGVGGRVALALDDIGPAWVLADHVLAGLRERV